MLEQIDKFVIEKSDTKQALKESREYYPDCMVRVIRKSFFNIIVVWKGVKYENV